MFYICVLFQWIGLEFLTAASSFPLAALILDNSQLIFYISTVLPLPLILSYDYGSGLRWALNPRGATQSWFLSVKHHVVGLGAHSNLRANERCFEIRPPVLLQSDFFSKTAAYQTQKPSQVTDTLVQPFFALSLASPAGGNQAQEARISRNRSLDSLC